MEVHIRKKYGNDDEIHNIYEWEKTYFPDNDKRWKIGRSAECLAEYILNYSQNSPEKLWEQFGIDTFDNTIYCYPEHSTAFAPEGFGKGGPGGGRNHDLMIETSNRVITIEAKTDESFDRYVAEIEVDSENKEKRYYKTYTALFGEEPIDDRIRYQLVQATVATAIEAKKMHKSRAALYVIEFNKEGIAYDGKALEQNAKDYEYFKNKLNKSHAFKQFCKEYNIELTIEHLKIKL